MSKKTETREETLARLAQDASEGATAARRFETLVKRVAKTPHQRQKRKNRNQEKPKALPDMSRRSRPYNRPLLRSDKYINTDAATADRPYV